MHKRGVISTDTFFVKMEKAEVKRYGSKSDT